MSVTFSRDSNFLENSNFKRVLFGEDGIVLEVELNEMQQIMRNELKNFIKEHIGNGIYNQGTYTLTDGVLTIVNEIAIVEGNMIPISSLSLALNDGESAYLSISEEVKTFEDTIKEYGNSQGSTIENTIKDPREVEETTRRIQLVFDLVKTNTDTTKDYLLLGTRVGTEFSIKANIIYKDGVSDAKKAYWDSKAEITYVDNQIASITETGIPKLLIYPIETQATVDNQTEFEITLTGFDKATDTVFVHQGGSSPLPPSAFMVDARAEGNFIVLDNGVPLGHKMVIYVFKNVPLGEDGSVSGEVIAPNSIPVDRLMTTSDDSGTSNDSDLRLTNNDEIESILTQIYMEV